MPELLIGCGRSRIKVLRPFDRDWTELTTLDVFPDCAPDVVHDLEVFPYPFADAQFDEIHAYCVLEHIGRQGDWRFFFAQWSEFARILKPNGLFCGIVPRPESPWAWGDPSHTRIITLEQFTFLSQRSYEQVGTTAMTDFRSVYRDHFDLIFDRVEDQRQLFILKKGFTHARSL